MKLPIPKDGGSRGMCSRPSLTRGPPPELSLQGDSFMVSSNWQGAIGRGALLVVLFWSGLAWTQTTPTDGPERIMVVHANGKSTRCRVLESWKLDDGRIAHLLQAVEDNEKITIVDEKVPAGDLGAHKGKGMPKRIFTWGVGKETPPEGSPVPPRMKADSAILLPTQGTLPTAPPLTSGPMIVQDTVEKAAISDPSRIEINIGRQENPMPAQVLDFQKGANEPKGPMIVNSQPRIVDTPAQPKSVEPMPQDKTIDIAQSKPMENTPSKPIENTQSKPIESAPVQASEPAPAIGARPPQLPRVNPALSRPDQPITMTTPLPGAPGSPQNPIIVNEPTEASRGWRPGDFLFGRKKNPDPIVVSKEPIRIGDAKKPVKSDDYLGAENKSADRIAKAPFSTAMSPAPDRKVAMPTMINSKDDAKSEK